MLLSSGPGFRLGGRPRWAAGHPYAAIHASGRRPIRSRSAKSWASRKSSPNLKMFIS